MASEKDPAGTGTGTWWGATAIAIAIAIATEEANKHHLDENAHNDGPNQRCDIDGGVDLPAAAGGVRRDEAEQHDGDEPVELPRPHLLAEIEPLLQQHDEDEQGRDERGGVADEEGLEARVVGPALEHGVAGAVAALVVVPEAARRAEPGHVGCRPKTRRVGPTGRTPGGNPPTPQKLAQEVRDSPYFYVGSTLPPTTNVGLIPTRCPSHHLPFSGF